MVEVQTLVRARQSERDSATAAVRHRHTRARERVRDARHTLHTPLAREVRASETPRETVSTETREQCVAVGFVSVDRERAAAPTRVSAACPRVRSTLATSIHGACVSVACVCARVHRPPHRTHWHRPQWQWSAAAPIIRTKSHSPSQDSRTQRATLSMMIYMHLPVSLHPLSALTTLKYSVL